MDIIITADGAKRRLPSGAEQSYPVKWSGDVPDADALRFIAEGRAQRIGGADAGFTPMETAVLKAAAQQAIADAQANGDGLTVDPETGEITVDGEGDADMDGGALSAAEVLASMTKQELDALAKQHGVRYTARKRADVEQDILAKLAAAAASPAADGAAGTGDA